MLLRFVLSFFVQYLHQEINQNSFQISESDLSAISTRYETWTEAKLIALLLERSLSENTPLLRVIFGHQRSVCDQTGAIKF